MCFGLGVVLGVGLTFGGVAGSAGWLSLGTGVAASLGVGGTQPLGGVVPDWVQLSVGANGAPQPNPLCTGGIQKLVS